MKHLACAFTSGVVVGVVTCLGLALYAGPDALIQTGLRLAAAQQTYLYDATPAHVVDEGEIVAELARPTITRKR